MPLSVLFMFHHLAGGLFPVMITSNEGGNKFLEGYFYVSMFSYFCVYLCFYIYLCLAISMIS